MVAQDYKITVRALEVHLPILSDIGDVLDVGSDLLDAVHHEITIETPSGSFVLNGMAIDRETGETGATAIVGDSTIRVVQDVNSSLADGDNGMRIVAEEVAWSGSKSEFDGKYLRAIEAGSHINHLNLDYRAMSLFDVAQNSNSVAATLLDAMDVDIPAKIQNLWDPGIDRIMLPQSGFSSDVNGFEDYSAGAREYYFVQLFEDINIKNVSKNVVFDYKNGKPVTVDFDASVPVNRTIEDAAHQIENDAGLRYVFGKACANDGEGAEQKLDCKRKADIKDEVSVPDEEPPVNIEGVEGSVPDAELDSMANDFNEKIDADKMAVNDENAFVPPMQMVSLDVA